MIWTFRIAVFVVPVLTGAFTYKLCRDLERHRHAARVAEKAEPPVAPNEEPVGPSGTDAGEGPPATRRFADSVLGVVILWILRRAGRRKVRHGPAPETRRRPERLSESPGRVPAPLMGPRGRVGRRR
jgi:hypothetical protein